MPCYARVMLRHAIIGDLVKDGTDSVTRVIVNQHRTAPTRYYATATAHPYVTCYDNKTGRTAGML